MSNKRISIIAAVLTALILGVAALAAHDWKPWAPNEDRGDCLRSHVVESYIIMYQSMCSGNSCTQVPYVMPTTDVVCDEWRYPNGDSPAYQAEYQVYLQKLAAWRQRNPEAD